MTDEEYLADCTEYASRSPDPSRKTGAIIVDAAGAVTARGRNHFPYGIACTPSVTPSTAPLAGASGRLAATCISPGIHAPTARVASFRRAFQS
jgi:hypothetical protein